MHVLYDFVGHPTFQMR